MPNRPLSTVRLPPSGPSPRPSSSLSLQPPSSASSLRPSSRASTHRPISPASLRPSSQASQRPASRFSYRPPKQASRLHALCGSLVRKIIGLSKKFDEEAFEKAVENTTRDLDFGTKAAPGADINKVDNRIRRLAQKARIHSHDTWAAALEASFAALRSHMQTQRDLDQEITVRNTPLSYRICIILAAPLSETSEPMALEYLTNLDNPQPRSTIITWKDILDEEPFQGQHWEGVYGLLPGSTVERWETQSLESTPPLSPLSFDDDRLSQALSPPSGVTPEREVGGEPLAPSSSPEQAPRTVFFYDHRQDIETLQLKQYWRKEWHIPHPTEVGDELGIGQPDTDFTSCPSSYRPHRSFLDSEHDAVREVLIGLQGRKNIMLRWTSRGGTDFFFEPVPNGPRVAHLTYTSLRSVMSSFCRLATTLEHLRKFVNRTYAIVIRPESLDASSRIIPGHSKRLTRCTEAFAEALNAQICAFDAWCASQEQAIGLATAGVGSPFVVSFLGLEQRLREAFSSSFDRALDVTRKVMRDISSPQDRDAEVWMLAELPAYFLPSTISSHFLDTLLQSAQDNLAIGDSVTYEVLMRMFVAAAEPMWAAVGRWLRDGMAIHEAGVSGTKTGHYKLDDEFFIEDNQLLVLDPDYWAEGFVLKTPDFDSAGLSPLPRFLWLSAPHILAAGKAVGLMRMLGIHAMQSRSTAYREPWLVLSSVIDPKARLYSVEDVSRLVFDSLTHRCQVPQAQLIQTLFEECQFWRHLSIIQDVFLMRRGDVMSEVADTIFTKIDSGQIWTDYHFLNSALRDAVEAGTEEQVDATPFRLTYQGSRRETHTRALACLSHLTLQYASPFPLTYVFGPTAISMYSSVFGLLLQIRRAKHALERILVRTGSDRVTRSSNDMKFFYAMRNRLSWFVCALQDFIVTYVLQTAVSQLNELLRRAKSLDDAIQIHDAHLCKVVTLCFLDNNNAKLLQTIISILSMCLDFGDYFVAFTGGTTYNPSRPRFATHRYRSRRVERLRNNTVGFVLPQTESSDSDSDVEYDAIEERLREASLSMRTSISLSDQDFFSQVDRMSGELDGLIRFFRRGVEELAGSTSEAALTFGILAFAMEDWDR
ncbi:Spc98 family-domain-containing protein [Vararia minispora EC-137]|uniref:Spc98 family-domain-containing protein n=1 Tax=Vararia minispora EC-137 TaxID=1314806 RepID=A0ACB8QM74_9AGAM|nr:Spc98 family-domain-containing protein [Vararia minispora EC-137]